MGEQRRIGGHVHDVGIPFHSGHEGCLQKGSVEMVPLLSAAMTRILAGKDLRPVAVITVIARPLAEKPTLGTIEMFIHQVRLQPFHFRPEVIKLFPLGTGT